MKYIRSYENNKGRKYYLLLPYDDRFVKSLEQIGCHPGFFINNDLIKKHNLKYPQVEINSKKFNI